MDANKNARNLHYAIVAFAVLQGVIVAPVVHAFLPPVRGLEFMRVGFSFIAVFPAALIAYGVVYTLLRPLLVAEWDLFVGGGYVATVEATSKDGAMGQGWKKGIPFSADLTVQLTEKEA